MYIERRIRPFRIAVQIFTKAPAQFASSKLLQRTDITATREYCREHDIFIVIHAIYLANFCNFDDAERARASVIEDLKIIEKLSHAPHKTGVIIHLGSNTKRRKIRDCFDDFVKNIKYCLKAAPGTAKLLLETSVKAMNGNEIFHDISMLGELFRAIPSTFRKRIGFVIDTCHVFSSGYDIRDAAKFEQFMLMWDREIGTKHIALIHLNDSKLPLDCRRDLHAEISRGFIFNKDGSKSDNTALKAVLKWCRTNNVPIVLETKSDQNREFDLLAKVIRKIY